MERLKKMEEDNSSYDSDLKEKLNEIIIYSDSNNGNHFYNYFVSKEDDNMLDKLLSGQDTIARKETLEELINKREELKIKKIEEIKHQRNKINELKFQASNPYHPNTKLFNDLTKLETALDQQAVEEEIKSWKDITFLQLKIMDENGGFYVSKYEEYNP